MSRRGWLLFGAMALIWGVPYLLIKVAVTELSPAMLVFARTGIAAALLLPLAAARGMLAPLLPCWRPLVVYTVVEICVPWLLLAFAEQRLSSSLTGLLVAAVPLVGAALARFGPDREPLGTRRLAGLLLGVAGVGALLGFEVGGGDLRAIAAVAVVAVGYAVGPRIMARQLRDLPALGVVAASLGLCALVFLPAAVLQAPGHWPFAAAATYSPGQVAGAVLGLAVVCTAVAFLLFFALVAEVGPARSVVITYVNPAVAVLLGVLVLGERFTVATAVGFALILAGSVLATAPSGAPSPGASSPAGTSPDVTSPGATSAPGPQPAGRGALVAEPAAER